MNTPIPPTRFFASPAQKMRSNSVSPSWEAKNTPPY